MKKKLWLSLIILILFNIAGGLFLRCHPLSPFNKKETVYIALAGPMTGKNSNQGKEMIRGAELFLENLQNTTLKGKQIELIIYDDHGDETIASEIATDIVSQKKAILVIGHLGSKESIAAGRIYKRNEICAVTASAIRESVTLDNDWYFRIIPNNVSQINLIVNYIRKILNLTSVNIISETNPYGETMRHIFEKLSRKIGVNIKNKWVVDSYAENSNAVLNKIAKEARSTQELTFCAVSSETAVRLFPLLRNNKSKQIVIGPDSLAKEGFIQAIKNVEKKTNIPGIFSDNIITVSPLILDIAGKNAQIFKQRYIKKYNRNPSLTAGCYYDAMCVAVEAIKKGNIQGKNHILSDRRKIQNALKSFYNHNHSIEGISGRIYFNRHGDINRLPYVGFYKKYKLLPDFIQYQPVYESNQIDNLFAKALNGAYIVNNGALMTKTHIVYTGIHINEITDLDFFNSTYTVDFYQWFHYKGNFNDSHIEYLNAVHQVNLGAPIEVLEDEKNIKSMFFRARAKFKEDFDFQTYPFERHMLKIKLQHPEMRKKQLFFIADPIDLPNLYEDIKWPNFDEDHWKLGKILLYHNIYEKHSSLGDPQFYNANYILNISRLTAEIPITRKNLPEFLIKNFAPVLILMFLIFIILFEFPAKYFGLSTSALAVLLVFNTLFYIKKIIELPTLYASTVDFVYLSMYVIIILSFFIVLLNKKHINDNKSVGHSIWFSSGRIVILLIMIGVVFQLYRYTIHFSFS